MLKKKILLVLIGFYIFWLGVLPLVLNNLASFVFKDFVSYSNYDIKIEHPRVKLYILPIIKISADKIAVHSKAKTDSLIVDKFQIKLRLLPLISGKVHINCLRINDIQTKLSLYQEISLNKNFFTNLQELKISCDSIKIDKFETLLFQKDILKPIKHYGSDFLFERKNRYFKFQMKSNLEIAGKASSSDWDLYVPKNNDIEKTIFNIKLSNFNLTPLRVYLKHYLPKNILDMEGIVNIYANKNELITELKNCSIIMKDKSQSIIFPSLMTIKSKFNITPNMINLNEVEIESKNIHCGLKGRIYNYFGKSMPTVDLNLRIDRSEIADIVNLLPGFEIEEFNFYKLKKYKITSNIIGNIDITGRLPEPSLKGDVYLSDLVLVKPIPKTTRGANIKISLKDKLVFFKAYVPAGDSQNVTVEGQQELYNIKYSELRVKSSENVNLKSAQDVLNPLHEILKFIIGPLPIMDIEGKGNIDIFVKGNRKNPHIRGLMNIKDSQVCFLDMPTMRLIESDAKIIFDDQNIIFNLLKGQMNKKDVVINGNANVFGKFDFDIKALGQQTFDLYNALINSELLKDFTQTLPPLGKAEGSSDLTLKVYGNVKKLSEIKINENVFAKGKVSTANNSLVLQNVPIKDFNSEILINGVDINADIKANIDNRPMTLKAKILKDFADINLDIPKLNPNFLAGTFFDNSDKILPYISLVAKYKGNISEVQYNKIFLEANVLEPIPNSLLNLQTGKVKLSNNKLQISDLKGFLGDIANPLNINLNVTNAFSNNYNINGNVKLKASNLALLNSIFDNNLLPQKFKNLLKDYRFNTGKLDVDINLINNKLNLFTDVGGLSLTYLPMDLPIEIINGNILVKNDVLNLNKINLLADNMPLLIDGDIKGIWDKQIFNIYLNSKPRQEFIDKYINNRQIYPIKIKGDIVCWARIKGVLNNYSLKSNIDLSKGSSIYHYGATIGDIENAISVYLDSNIINNNIFKIKEFSYEKIVDSLQGKKTELNMLKAKGGLSFLKDDVIFDDLIIKTNHPTDARIFNIIFRKPNIKQGYFTSDLKVNGSILNPKILGDFKISETDIPFLDMAIKNIELLFRDKTIEMSTKGDILGSDFNFEGVFKNKLTKPYIMEKGFLYTNKLDLNRVLEKFKTSEVENVQYFDSFDDMQINSIIFKNLDLKADNIRLRNIHATNFEAQMQLNEKGLFNTEDFSFKIAQGEVKGKYNYNLKNNNTGLNLDMKNINANDITWALFDLREHIYGDMTGNVRLSCNGTNFESCMQTLNGVSNFNVVDGKMPKLGSLEYLLRASNLIKGGFTGITINGIVDLVSPLKTGEFSEIYGSIHIKDGVARDIEISSRGKNLSLFIVGTYNFATSIADMQVFGLLSRKLSTLFGPIGNISLNTLFNIIPGIDLSKDNSILDKINKIPGIELSSKAFRKFIADIKGNINGEDYVTSFQWIN